MTVDNCKKMATNPFLPVGVTLLQCDFEDIPIKKMDYLPPPLESELVL